MKNTKVKVGIISYTTHSKHLNYGATLHSFAFQQLLKQKFNTDSVIVDYIANSLIGYNIKFPVLNFNLSGKFFGIFNTINWAIGFRSNLVKYRKFQSFIKTKLITTTKVYCWDSIKEDTTLEEYGIGVWVCESDVIWKIVDGKSYGFDYGFFLKFAAAKNKVKVAYSPSIQSRPFSDSEEKEFLKLTSAFDAVSVREKQSAEYLTKLLGKKIDWLLDPTLLLNADSYSEILELPSKKNYVLVYNCMRNDRRMLREAEYFAKSKGLSLIEISNFSINKLLFNHKVITDAGIEEWLGYFKNADYIICNAFHGFCFSVIFKKEVFVFQRDYSDYRMQNITTELGCKDHFIPCSSKVIPMNVEPIDYYRVYERLEQLRNKAYSFISNYIIKTITPNCC